MTPPESRERSRHLVVDGCSHHLVDDWLAAAMCGIAYRRAAAMAPIHSFLRLAPTPHDSHLRLVGLITIAARRCALLLPTPERGYWSIGEDVDGTPLDDAPPHIRFAVRLVTAYANDDEGSATDLVVAHVRQLQTDREDVQNELWRVFMYLSNLYLFFHDAIGQRSPEHAPFHLRTLAGRLAAAWRRGWGVRT